jgi:hypothetical protein
VKPGRAARVGKACAARVKRVYSGTMDRGSSMRAYAAGSGRSVFTNITRLRESAIEPLPQRERLPSALRELEWDGKEPRPDAAAIVRRLRGHAQKATEHNELGCAYALLASETARSAYWLDAIRHLRKAVQVGDDKLAEVAAENLERVGAASKYKVEP